MKAMKPHILPLLLVLIGTATLCGCSQDELPGADPTVGNPTVSATPFTITVTDGGYAPADAHPHTRATENGYQTQFTAGDRIGVFAVKDGAIVTEVNNLCLTAQPGDSGNALVWQPDPKTTQLPAGATYYAYYPYQETLTGEPVPTATTAEDFFANVITGWTPAADQSTHANYTAQDLMIAQGTVEGGKNLSFSMQHKMALVVIELPKMKYTFNNSSPTVPDYIIDLPGTNFTGFTPYRMSAGTYRYLLKPSTTEKLSGSYTNGGTHIWEFSPSALAAGNYKVFRVDEATVTEQSHTLAAGDFYMKDGSLVGKDETLTPEQQAACIGVVFWVGDATAQDKTLKADHPECTHGLVVALKDAIETGEGTTKWQEPAASVQGWLNNNGQLGFLAVESNLDASDPLNNIQGYNNTKAIEAYNEANQTTLVLPVDAVLTYRDNVIAPNNSSDWYVPSLKELTLLLGKDIADVSNNWKQIGTDTRDLLNGKDAANPGQFEKLGGFAIKIDEKKYWSTTEYGDEDVLFVHFGSGSMNMDDKGDSRRVRCILAF